MKLRFLRKWFIERSYNSFGKVDSKKSFKLVLQYEDNNKWENVPIVDDIESMEKAKQDLKVLRFPWGQKS